MKCVLSPQTFWPGVKVLMMLSYIFLLIVFVLLLFVLVSPIFLSFSMYPPCMFVVTKFNCRLTYLIFFAISVVCEICLYLVNTLLSSKKLVAPNIYITTLSFKNTSIPKLELVYGDNYYESVCYTLTLSSNCQCYCS